MVHRFYWQNNISQNLKKHTSLIFRYVTLSFQNNLIKIKKESTFWTRDHVNVKINLIYLHLITPHVFLSENNYSVSFEQKQNEIGQLLQKL